MDGLLITGSDLQLIYESKVALDDILKVRGLENLRHFLGIEVMRLDKEILRNWWKYYIELISEVDLSSVKLAPTPHESYCKHNIL